MKTLQQSFTQAQKIELSQLHFTPDLLLVFSGLKNLEEEKLSALRKAHPGAVLLGCSTAGEIAGTTVSENSTVVTAVQFEKATVQYRDTHISHPRESRQAGIDLVKGFEPQGLKHLFVLSDGLNVNGSELVEGLKEGVNNKVSVTGGLAADGADFNHTYIIDNKGAVADHKVAALAFYGKDLQVGYGSTGGWDSFGIDRKVTRSEGNVLYEIDGEPALQLYKSFLGEQARNLPASALLFPLSMRTKAHSQPTVRTILGVNEEDQSMTFAGNITQGAYVRLMKANMDRLIDGAQKAAQVSRFAKVSSELNILISCVGRKLVLKQLVEEELEAVAEVLGDQATSAGFYSYGEIAPFLMDTDSELHNQTMTITTLSEK